MRKISLVAITNVMYNVISFPLLEVIELLDLELLSMNHFSVTKVLVAVLNLFVSDGPVKVTVVGIKVFGQLIEHQSSLCVS